MPEAHAEQGWQTFLQWPIEKDDEGNIVMARLEFSGPLSAKGFHQIEAFMKILGEAWFPQPPAQPTPAQMEELEA